MGEKDAEAEESSPPASPTPAAYSTPTAAPITVQPNHRTWPHYYRPHYFLTYACFEYIYRYAHSVRLRFMADTNYQNIDRKRRKMKSKSRLITKVWRSLDVLYGCSLKTRLIDRSQCQSVAVKINVISKLETLILLMQFVVPFSHKNFVRLSLN